MYSTFKIKLILNKILKYFFINLTNFFLIFPSEILKKRLINFNNIKIYFSATNSITYRRYKRFEKDGKEKSTIRWIDSFKKKDIFFDVGANVGVFSLYAAIKKSSKVYAFEPEPNSFIDLFNSINLNQVNVRALLIPLDKERKVDFFLLQDSFEAGKSGHNFGQINKKKVGGGVLSKSRQNSFMICSESISNLVYNKKIPKPNYIKIDVDGAEEKILFDLGNLMKGNNLKSILIEGRSELYLKYLKQYKFFLDEKFCDETNSCFTKEEYL